MVMRTAHWPGASTIDLITKQKANKNSQNYQNTLSLSFMNARLHKHTMHS